MPRLEDCPHCGESQRGEQILSRVNPERGVAIRGWSKDGPSLYYDKHGQVLKQDGQPCYDADGQPLHSWLTIGCEIPGIYDGILFWECPHCGGRWHRFSPGERRWEQALPYVARKRGERVER